MLYEIISTGSGSSITVLHNGEVFTANQQHPAFAQIVEGAVKGDPDVLGLFDRTAAYQAAFDKVSDRLSIRDGLVYVDGEVMDNTLGDLIVRFQKAGVNDYQPLVAFAENLLANPNARSREMLFDWLRDRNFTITDDGYFIAYKGLRADLTSIHSGPAVVDGVPRSGNIPNAVGSTIEMARGDVNRDPLEGCSYGLHAGTWEYASTFGPRVVKVKINPRDVVSVPHDCDFQKLRTCRYEVLAEIANPDYAPLVGWDGDEAESDWDEDEFWGTMPNYERG